MNISTEIVDRQITNNADAFFCLTDEKRKFFQWADSVMAREDYDAFIDQHRERVRGLGITDADRDAYRAEQMAEVDF